jgi:hypothetical protein
MTKIRTLLVVLAIAGFLAVPAVTHAKSKKGWAQSMKQPKASKKPKKMKVPKVKKLKMKRGQKPKYSGSYAIQ